MVTHYKVYWRRDVGYGVQQQTSAVMRVEGEHTREYVWLQANLSKPNLDGFGNRVQGWMVSEIEPIGVE